MRLVFGYIWMIWGALWIVITGALAGLGYFIVFNTLRGLAAHRAMHRVTKAWAWIYSTIILVFVRHHGKRPEQSIAPAIFVSNHKSAMDIPICYHVNPVPFSILAKRQVLKIPVIGYLASKGHVLVDRSSEESRQKSFAAMCAHLEAGKSIHIYIEGTRNRSNAPLAKVYDGAFRLAIATGCPIVPFTMTRTARVLPASLPLIMLPTLVHCYWHSAIATKGLTIDDLPQLKAAVEQAISAPLLPQAH